MNEKLLEIQIARNGLTLLEIMFATLVLAFSLIPIAGLLGQATKATKQDSRMIEGLQILEKTGNAVVQEPFKCFPVGNNITSIYATSPIILGAVPGNYGATYTVRLDCTLIPVTFRARRVRVWTSTFNASAPVDGDFEGAVDYPFGNGVKEVDITVSWNEPNGVARNVSVKTYLAKLE